MSSSSKTLQRYANEGSTECSQTLPPSGLMRAGSHSRAEQPASPCAVPASSCWPSPTVEDRRASRRHGYTITGNPGTTLTDAMLLWYGDATGPGTEPSRGLNPDFCEALLGLPEGWTKIGDESACAALATPSRRPKRP